VPSTLLDRSKREKRGGTERKETRKKGGGCGITIRRSSTSMEAAVAMEETAPYTRE